MEDDDNTPYLLMRVTDDAGEVYYLEGHDVDEAHASFGSGCLIEYLEARTFHPTG